MSHPLRRTLLIKQHFSYISPMTERFPEQRNRSRSARRRKPVPRAPQRCRFPRRGIPLRRDRLRRAFVAAPRCGTLARAALPAGAEGFGQAMTTNTRRTGATALSAFSPAALVVRHPPPRRDPPVRRGSHHVRDQHVALLVILLRRSRSSTRLGAQIHADASAVPALRVRRRPGPAAPSHRCRRARSACR